jgi:hypothetical protein
LWSACYSCLSDWKRNGASHERQEENSGAPSVSRFVRQGEVFDYSFLTIRF